MNMEGMNPNMNMNPMMINQMNQMMMSQMMGANGTIVQHIHWCLVLNWHSCEGYGPVQFPPQGMVMPQMATLPNQLQLARHQADLEGQRWNSLKIKTEGNIAALMVIDPILPGRRNWTRTLMTPLLTTPAWCGPRCTRWWWWCQCPQLVSSQGTQASQARWGWCRPTPRILCTRGRSRWDTPQA